MNFHENSYYAGRCQMLEKRNRELAAENERLRAKNERLISMWKAAIKTFVDRP